MAYTKSDTSSKSTDSQNGWLHHLLIYKNTNLAITKTKAKRILHVRDFECAKYSVSNDNESLFVYLPREKELRAEVERS